MKDMRCLLITIYLTIGFNSFGQNFKNVVSKISSQSNTTIKVQFNLKGWEYNDYETYGDVLAGHEQYFIVGHHDSEKVLKPIILKIEPSGETSKIILPNIYQNGIENKPMMYDMTENYIMGSATKVAYKGESGTVLTTISNPVPFIMERVGEDTWEFKQILKLDRKKISPYYGADIAIEGDVAVIGASRDMTDENEENKMKETGAIYIFIRSNNGKWEFVQKLVSSNRTKREYFGISVDIKENCIIAGSLYNVYIFNKDSTGKWIERQKINSTYKGLPVSCSGSKFVGEDISITSGTRKTQGLYMFRKDEYGKWTEYQSIIPSDLHKYDLFGLNLQSFSNEVVITNGSNKNFMLVGAPLQDNEIRNSGAIYAYRKQSTGNWSTVQKIIPDVPFIDLNYGRSIVMNNTHLIIGSVMGIDIIKYK